MKRRLCAEELHATSSLNSRSKAQLARLLRINYLLKPAYPIGLPLHPDQLAAGKEEGAANYQP